MDKIVIKYPDEKVNKFRLQRYGRWRGRQYKTAIGLVNGLERLLPQNKLREKTAVQVKEGRYEKGKYEHEITNETVDSDDPSYLLYAVSCFLEDELSDDSKRKAERRYLENGR